MSGHQGHWQQKDKEKEMTITQDAPPRLGAIGRARLSVDAVETLAKIRSQGRTVATAAEREILAGWSGWGPLTPVFAPTSETWADLSERLRRVLPADDVELGMQGTYNAFYTPYEVAQAMWAMLAELGFTDGSVLEPGCGGGVFMATAPAGAVMTGVERDPTAADICRLMNPSARVITSALQDARLSPGYAAAIGNVPFGDVSVHDPNAPAAVRGNLHDYFVWRAVHLLAPGGVAVLLTSRHTMDKSDLWGRAAIAEMADLVDAFRLPNGALGGGTEAVADILVLRKREQDAVPRGGVWKNVQREQFGWSNPINEYWTACPQRVLGEMHAGATAQYGLAIGVKPRPGDAPAGEQLARVAAEVGASAARRNLLWQPQADPSAVFDDETAHEQGWQEGSLRALDDGGVCRVEGGKLVPVARAGAELRALLKLRDLAVELVGCEANHAMGDRLMMPLRSQLAGAYSAYVRTYGALNRCTMSVTRKRVEAGSELAEEILAGAAAGEVDSESGEIFSLTTVRRTPQMGGFRHDPDSALVLALEVFDEESGEARPAPILTARQNVPVRAPARAGNAREALSWSLNRKGRVDLGYIAGLLGTTAENVPAKLGELVFEDPKTFTWVVAEEYLSGNVRRKLAVAELAAANGDVGRFDRNVTALTEVQPPWLEADKITANLGAAWIPTSDVEDFVKHLLRYAADITRVEETGQWEVAISNSYRSTSAATATWGTYDVDAYRLIELALNGKVPVVKRLVEIDGVERERKDADASMLANEKQRQIKERFEAWIWEDAQRTDRLVTYFNTHFNCRQARKFSGKHITVAGMQPGFKPYAHQFEYVARAIVTPAGLCGHPVGAGKTATMAMTAMKMRELGLANKPMVVVPNHLIEQIDREFRQLFPGARIMSSSASTISKGRRAFNARCATQEWDIILVTHSAFDVMAMSPQTEERYIADQILDLEMALTRNCPNGHPEGRMTKNLAKRKDNLQAKLLDIRERAYGYDLGLTFESTGVDYLIVDEFHYYKNLAVPVRTDGFSVRPSKRATHLDMALSWLRRRGGRYASMFTGTPISNTMLELYVVLRYLIPDQLDELGIGSADAWARTFVQFVTSVDVTIDGGNFQLVTRPSLFVNAPELRMLLSECADIRTAKQLGLPRPRFTIDVFACSPTRVQMELSAELVERAEKVKHRSYQDADYDENGEKKKVDNMLAICGDGRRMATDPMLVGRFDPEDGKLAAVADNMIRIWREDPTSLQLGFCDVGTPNAKMGSQTYGRLRRMLTDRGMPVGLIRFRHDAKTDGEVGQLFSDCRVDGKVAVLFGSTDKMGVGTNIQKRVLAMHHIDAPWRPADVEQRDGRGVRPGNRYKIVYIFRYVVERTFDAYNWQLLTRKIGYISQVMSGTVDRTIEDISTDTTDAYAAIKAAAANQPLLLEKATIESQVKSLRSLQRGHQATVSRLRTDIIRSQERIGQKTRSAEAYESIAAAAEELPDGLSEEETARLHELMKQYTQRYRYSQPETFAGVQVTLSTWSMGERSEGHPLVRVRGGGDADWMDIQAYKFWTPQRMAKEFADLLQTSSDRAAGLRREIAEMEAENERAAGIAAKPFADSDVLTSTLARLDQIEAELTAAALCNEEEQTEQAAVIEAPPASVRMTRLIDVEPEVVDGETAEEPSVEPAAVAEPVDLDQADTGEADDNADDDELDPETLAMLGELMEEFDAETIELLNGLMVEFSSM